MFENTEHKETSLPDLSGQKVGDIQNAKHCNKRGRIYRPCIHNYANRILLNTFYLYISRGAMWRVWRFSIEVDSFSFSFSDKSKIIAQSSIHFEYPMAVNYAFQNSCGELERLACHARLH
jgi:hypothetical protein